MCRALGRKRKRNKKKPPQKNQLQRAGPWASKELVSSQRHSAAAEDCNSRDCSWPVARQAHPAPSFFLFAPAAPFHPGSLAGSGSLQPVCIVVAPLSAAVLPLDMDPRDCVFVEEIRWWMLAARRAALATLARHQWPTFARPPRFVDMQAGDWPIDGTTRHKRTREQETQEITTPHPVSLKHVKDKAIHAGDNTAAGLVRAVGWAEQSQNRPMARPAYRQQQAGAGTDSTGQRLQHPTQHTLPTSRGSTCNARLALAWTADAGLCRALLASTTTPPFWR